MEEDRSALFNQLKGFSQRKLKKVETKVVTGLGEQLVEKRGAKGLQVLSGGTGSKGDASANQEPARKLDLQVGFILPGLLIGSQDVAQDKSSLDSYGIEYILNLDSEVENKYEDDYNYKNVPIKDKPDFDLDSILDDCFDFIDEGRHRGNVLVHCSGTTGLSRSTSICIAYLMKQEKQSFVDAFNNVKEARSFVKPNDGFIKQLKDYEVKLRGAQKVKESGIDDPFALRKKQEIEQEKAMVAGAASVKNRMKMFGATLETGGSGGSPSSARSKSVSPMPSKPSADPYASSQSTTTSSSSSTRPQPSASKWAKPTTTNNDRSVPVAQQSKSMTPEPRKSNTSSSSDWQSSRDRNMPPPPPPPMPTTSLHANDKSVKPMNSNASSSSNKSYTSAPPPPPPQPPAGHLLRDSSAKTSPVKQPTSSKPATTTTTTTSTTHVKSRKPSVSESSDDEDAKSKMVFGRKPPPPMKIRGGLSIERNEQSATSDKQTSSNKTHTKGSLQLPLKKQFTVDSDGDSGARSDNPRAPSPSAALRAAKQQASATAATNSSGSGHRDSTSGSGGGQLNRSSTKKLLNLIKTKTRTDLTLPDGDENDEIEALLGALESESIDNIDWDELGLDEAEVKDIIKRGGQSSSDSSDADSSADEDEEEEDEEEEEVETSTVHYVIRSK